MTSWHILGAGAMGCLWGANLSRSNHPVILLLKDRQDLARFRRSNSVTLHQGDTDETIPVSAILSNQVDSIIEYLLVTTKSHQTMDALDSISSLLSPHCTIFLVQNGMGVAERIIDVFPDTSLYCGVTTEGAYCPEPFSVIHAGIGSTQLGSFTKTENPDNLLQHLPTEYLDIQLCDDIQKAQWQKLVINCAINGLTALYQCRNGDLLTIPEAYTRLENLCEEIELLIATLNIVTINSGMLDDTVSVIRLTAGNFSSMYQDIHNKRLTEINYINGYLINKAEEQGLPCPENRKLVEDIRKLENRLGCV